MDLPRERCANVSASHNNADKWSPVFLPIDSIESRDSLLTLEQETKNLQPESRRLTGTPGTTTSMNQTSYCTIKKPLEMGCILGDKINPMTLEAEPESLLKWLYVSLTFAIYLLSYGKKNPRPIGYLIAIFKSVLNAHKTDDPKDHPDGDVAGGNWTNTNNSSNFGFGSSVPGKQQGNSKRHRGRRNRDDPPDQSDKQHLPGLEYVKGSPLYFACPFFKSDQTLHWDCHKFAFKRVVDVRLHIRRNHCEPIHCSVCGARFDDAGQRDEHTRARMCQSWIFPQSWATTLQLNSMQGRSNSEPGRWFDIWDTIFPDRRRPASPYISLTLWGFLAEITCDVLARYRHEQRYLQIVGSNGQLGADILNDLVLYLFDNSHSPTPIMLPSQSELPPQSIAPPNSSSISQRSAYTFPDQGSYSTLPSPPFTQSNIPEALPQSPQALGVFSEHQMNVPNFPQDREQNPPHFSLQAPYPATLPSMLVRRVDSNPAPSSDQNFDEDPNMESVAAALNMFSPGYSAS